MIKEAPLHTLLPSAFNILFDGGYANNVTSWGLAVFSTYACLIFSDQGAPPGDGNP